MRIRFKSEVSGKVPLATIREWFEKTVADNRSLAATKLDTWVSDQPGVHYTDEETNTLFVGFVFAMKVAESIEMNGGLVIDCVI